MMIIGRIIVRLPAQKIGLPKSELFLRRPRTAPERLTA
jgi:hypothetical protein